MRSVIHKLWVDLNSTVGIADSIFDFDSIFLWAVLLLVLPLVTLERISASLKYKNYIKNSFFI